MVGDPHYMAPEQISGQGYEYGVDYWSLGILVFAMLHVETPFAQHTSETQVHLYLKSRQDMEVPSHAPSHGWLKQSAPLGVLPRTRVGKFSENQQGPAHDPSKQADLL